ncbi:MAG TPA: tRNA pseudouridine(13) synthase TruD [Anaerolineae bacterium]|nr:tRNA pseudouridine(13) synthase TruD [Anaerolineae bacterium]
MQIKRFPEDFQVEEDIMLPENQGAYAYYRVEKRGRPTLIVRDEMAAKLKVTPSALVFPALKDASAVTVQYASVRKHGPEEIRGSGFVAQRVQWGPRALRPRDLRGNRFTMTIRELSQPQATAMHTELRTLETQGLPNYFDDQRFGSYSNDGFIGKAILQRDAEQAVRFYLSETMLGDPQSIREFKALVKSHWGQWGYLLHLAPRPSNYRSVITYLKDHPHEYRKAVNLIQDRLLSIYLSAYQSWIWNNILAHYFDSHFPTSQWVDIIGTTFPLPQPGPALEKLQQMQIDLPRLTARYDEEVQKAADAIFEKEGLTLNDFKARILRRVYLSRGERPAWFTPADVTVGEPFADDTEYGDWAITVSFTLQSGYYAPLVLKAAAARIGAEFRAR